MHITEWKTWLIWFWLVKRWSKYLPNRATQQRPANYARTWLDRGQLVGPPEEKVNVPRTSKELVQLIKSCIIICNKQIEDNLCFQVKKIYAVDSWTHEQNQSHQSFNLKIWSRKVVAGIATERNSWFFFLMKYATEHFGWIRSEKNYKFISSFFKLGDSFHIRIKFGCFDAAAVSPLHYIHWVGPTKNFHTFFPSFIIYYFSFYFMPYTKNIYENCS